jgi:hypothetical protein
MGHPTESSRKRFYGLVAVAVLVCSLAVAAAVQRMRLLGAHAREEIARLLESASGAQASVQATELDYASWTLVAHGVELHDQARSLLQAGELRARPSFNALLRGHLELHSLELTAAAVHLQAADLQRLKRTALGSPAPVGTLSVRVAQLHLELTADSALQLTTAELALSGNHFEGHAAKAVFVRGGEPAADARLSISGQVNAAQGGGQLRMEQAHLAGQALAQPVTLSWHSEGERVTCEGTLALGPDAGALAVALTLTADSAAPITLRVRPQALQLRRALALGHSTQALTIDASVDGEVELRGTLEPLALTGPLHLVAHTLQLGRDPALLAIPQLKAAGNARLDANGLAIDALGIALPSGTFEGSAHFGRDAELTAELSAPELGLADLGPVGGLALAGHGHVALRAKGPVQAPELHVSLGLSDAALAGVALGKLNAELDVTDAGRSLAIQHAEIMDSQRRLSSDGSLLRFAAGLAEARARIKVAHLPLTELYRLLGAGDDPVLRRLQGDTAGDVDLTYRRAETDHQLELELGLRLLDIELAGYRFDRGQLRARVAIPDGARGLAGGVLTLEQMTLAAGDGTLELSGEMRRGALGMHVGMRALPLARDAWFHAHFASLNGRIDGQGELKSDAATARADIALSVDDLKFADAALGRVQLRALLRDRASATDSECSEGPAALNSGALGAAPSSSAWLICGKGLRDQLRVDLALGNGESRPVRGLFALDDFALSAFLPEASPGARVPGTLTAQLRVSGGGLDNLDRLSGQLRVEKLALGADDMALASSAPFEVQLQAGEIALKGAVLRGPKQKFVLSAAGALGHSARLIADGNVSAGAFARASEPVVDAFGDVGLHLEWSPWTEPRLRGRLALSAVTVRVGATTFLRNLGGTLEVSDERVHVAAVSAELGGGQLQLDGQLALSGLSVANYALKLTAAHVALEPQPLIEVLLDADTHVDWSGGAALPRLSGGIMLKRALYGKQIQVNEAIAALSHQGSGAAKKAPRDRLLVDVTLSHEQPLRIRNSLLDGEVMVIGPEHKLRIVGSDRQLGLSGQLAITRGRVLFYGDQFHVTHGEIAFTDPTRIAPQFDVSAVADRPKRPDTSIVFHAHGTREAFDVEVHCEAPGSGEPPPFTCKYARDHVHCDSFEQLVALWLCRTKPTLSQAESAH